MNSELVMEVLRKGHPSKSASANGDESGWEILKCLALRWPDSRGLAQPLEFPVGLTLAAFCGSPLSTPFLDPSLLQVSL